MSEAGRRGHGFEVESWVQARRPANYNSNRSKGDAVLDQLTKEQAVAIAEAGEWREWPDEKIVQLQLFQNRLCMDFGRFHEATEAVLGRPVFTHEFGSVGVERLRQEYLGKRPAPTFDEIMALVPAEKLIAVTQ